jgi:hypothetical protein
VKKYADIMLVKLQIKMLNRRSKAILVLLGSIFVALGVSFWGLKYNTGELIIESSVVPFTIKGMYDDPVLCELKVCVYEVKPKIYQLSFENPDFTAQNAEAILGRNQELRLRYEPEKIPSLIPYKTSTLTYKNLLYLEDGAKNSTDVLLRSTNEELVGKITNFAGSQPLDLWTDQGHQYALVTTEDLTYVELNLAKKRKRVVEPEAKMTNLRLVGKDQLVWSEGSFVYIGEYGFPPKSKELLKIANTDQISSIDSEDAYLISKENLASGGVGEGETSDLLTALSKSNDAKELSAEIAKSGSYKLYKLNLETKAITFLKELSELPAETKVTIRKEYDRNDLTPIFIIEAGGREFELRR